MYQYNQFGDTNNFAGYAPSGSKTSGFPELNAQFTTSTITVDGVADSAYSSATASNIGTNGSTVKALWDGPVLYLLVNAKGNDATYFGFDYYNDRTAGQGDVQFGQETTNSDKISAKMSELSKNVRIALPEVLEYLEYYPSIDSDKMSEIAGKTVRTGQRMLGELVAVGILKVSGSTRNRVYLLK